MKRILTVAILGVTIARPMGAADLAERVAALTWDARAPLTVTPGVLAERAQSLTRLAMADPKTARRFLLTDAEAAYLRNKYSAGADLVETTEQIDAAASVSILDSFETGSATYIFQVRTSEGALSAYSEVGPAGGVRCGGSYRLKGRRIGRTMFVESAATLGGEPAAACTTTGEQHVAIIVVEFPNQHIPFSLDQVREQFLGSANSSAAFFQEASYGRMRLTGEVFGVSLDREYSCEEVTAMKEAAFARLAPVVPWDRFRGIYFLQPLVGDCAWGGLGSVGCSELMIGSTQFRISSSVQNVRQQTAFLTDVFNHEFGHNLGLDHARSAQFSGEPVGPDRTHVIVSEYGDTYSVMGRAGTPPHHYAANHKFQLGWLDQSQIATIDSDGIVNLSPFAAVGGLKAVRVRRNIGDGQWLWLEYRRRIGFDASGPGSADRGPIVRTEVEGGGLQLLDFSPPSLDFPSSDFPSSDRSFEDTALDQGALWHDPYSELSLEPLQSDANGLTLGIRYERSCTSVTWPFDTVLGTDAGTFRVTIKAAASCAWNAFANNAWLDSSAPAGAGDGDVWFSYEAISAQASRSGSVTVARQTLLLTQEQSSRAEPVQVVEYVVPNRGTLSLKAWVSFELGIVLPENQALVSLELLLSSSSDPSNSCRLQFDANKGTTLLYADDGLTPAGAPMDPAGYRPVSNSQCRAAPADLYSVGQASKYQLSVSIMPLDRFPSLTHVWARIRLNGDGQERPWKEYGVLSSGPECQPSSDVKRLNFSRTAGHLAVAIQAPNCSWQVTTEPWIQISQLRGEGSAALVVAVNANPTTTERSGTITVKDTVIEVIQAAAVIQLPGSEIIVGRTAGRAQLLFASNLKQGDFQVESQAAWIRATVQLSILGPLLSYEWDINLGGLRKGKVLINGVPLVIVQQEGSRPGDYRIQTVAGSAYIGDVGLAKNAWIRRPEMLATDRAGNVIFLDGYRIRRLTTGGTIETIAGTGFPGSIVDDAKAMEQALPQVYAIATEPQGTVLFSDFGRIYRVTSDGLVRLVAGGGRIATDTPDARTAVLGGVQGLTSDDAGNIYFTESGWNRIRVVESSGGVRTLAGDTNAGFSGDGGPAISARVSRPNGIVWDRGDLFFADNGNYRIRVIRNGRIETVAGNGNTSGGTRPGSATATNIGSVRAVAAAPGGRIYFTNGSWVGLVSAGVVSMLTGTGSKVPAEGLSLSEVDFGSSIDTIASGESGTLLLGDVFHGMIWGVEGGKLVHLAGRNRMGDIGDAGPATATMLSGPAGLACGRDGLYIADSGNMRVRRVRSTGIVETVAGGAANPLWFPDGPSPTYLQSPQAVAQDATGNLYIADVSYLRKLATDGTVTTVAGGGSASLAQSEKMPARQAYLNGVSAVVIDSSGAVYFSEQNGYRVRRLNNDGTVQIVAGTGEQGDSGNGGPAIRGKFISPRGLAFDKEGNLYVADYAQVRRIARDGTISAYAGSGKCCFSTGTSTSTDMLPTGVSFDRNNSLLITDGANDVVWRVQQNGTIEKIAGSFRTGRAGDGGPAWTAELGHPAGICVDSSGAIFISEGVSHQVRLMVVQ